MNDTKNPLFQKWSKIAFQNFVEKNEQNQVTKVLRRDGRV
jgi:hypothetical protein